MQDMQADDVHRALLGANGGWALGAEPAAARAWAAALGDAMRDESSAQMPLSVWAHRRLEEPGAGSGSADEDGCMEPTCVSGGQTHVAGAGGVWIGPNASFVAASMPSSEAHRRSGTAASADTVRKWEQLLRDNPNDPMVSDFHFPSAPAPRSMCLRLAVQDA